MLRKAERFYLHALRDAGVKYSPLFAMRRESTGTNRRATTKKKAVTNSATNGTADRHEKPTDQSNTPPSGMIDIPIAIDDQSHIRVPRSIAPDDMPVVQAALAMVVAMAERNGKHRK